MTRYGPNLGILLVAALWGSSYTAMQQVGQHLDVGAFLLLRFGIAAVVVTAVTLPGIRNLSRDECAVGVQYGVLLFGVLALETLGVQHTSASNAGFLIAVSVVVVPLAERLLFKSELPLALYPCVLLALAGTALLTLNGDVALGRGDLLILAAALLRGTQTAVYGARARSVVMSPLRVTSIQMWVVTILGGAVIAVTPGSATAQISSLPVSGWILLGYLAVFCTALAFLIQLWAAPKAKATQIGLILSAEPVFAALTAVTFAGESLAGIQLLGGILILGAVVGGRLAESAVPSIPRPLATLDPAAVDQASTTCPIVTTKKRR